MSATRRSRTDPVLEFHCMAWLRADQCFNGVPQVCTETRDVTAPCQVPSCSRGHGFMAWVKLPHRRRMKDA